MAKGRKPVSYSESLVDELCYRLLTPRSLKSVCEDEDMPHRSSVYNWLNEYPAFRQKYNTAREMQVDAYVDEIFEIADNKEGDTFCDEYGNEKPNHEWMQRSKLRVDVRKWYASKICPKLYGDKVGSDVLEQISEIVLRRESGEKP